MSKIFDSRDTEYKSPFGAAVCGATVRFAVRPGDENVTGVTLLLRREFAGTEQEVALSPGDDGRWQGVYTAPEEPELVWYAFRFSYPEGQRLYGLHGFDDQARWQLTVYDDSRPTPAWFGRGITYQIFPDRFCRTRVPDPAGMVGDRVVHQDWDDTPVWRPDAQGIIRNNDFFGGSLAGITSRLDYLQSMGVGTLYLCPIFESDSNHRYDTADYRRIDPMLGTEEDFRTLCREAGCRGIRVMLDGVFNHTGSNSRYFNAQGFYPELGAAQSRESQYYNWYSFHPWPEDYDAWWGIKTLPAVQESADSYRRFIIRADELSLPDGGPGLAAGRRCRRLSEHHGGHPGALSPARLLQRPEHSGHPRHAPDPDPAGSGGCAGYQGRPGGIPSLPCPAAEGPSPAAGGRDAAVLLPRLPYGVLWGRGRDGGL